MLISHIFNLIYCYGFDFDRIRSIELQCLIRFYFILIEIKIKFQYYVCRILHLLESEFALLFILSSLKASFFQQGKWPFLTVNTVNNGLFINCFDKLITHDRGLYFGLLSSLGIHTPALSFSPFGGWQGDSSPLGGLTAPKTTTAKTLTNTAMKTTKTTMMTITGR